MLQRYESHEGDTRPCCIDNNIQEAHSLLVTTSLHLLPEFTITHAHMIVKSDLCVCVCVCVCVSIPTVFTPSTFGSRFTAGRGEKVADFLFLHHFVGPHCWMMIEYTCMHSRLRWRRNQGLVLLFIYLKKFKRNITLLKCYH
jgi:hypothetical protein